MERCLFAVGGFPATRGSAYDTHRVLPPDDLCGSKAGPSLDVAPVIRSALRTALPRPITPYYTEFSDLLQAEVTKLLQAEVSGTRIGSVPQRSDIAGYVANLVSDLGAAADGRAPPAS